MNSKGMLLVAALFLPLGMQGCWKNVSTSFKNTLSLRDLQVAEYKKTLPKDEKRDAKVTAFDANYNGWYYAVSKLSFGLSGISALFGAAAARCPKYHNEKVAYGAFLTSGVSLLSGLYCTRAACHSLKRAKSAADKAE